MPLSLSILRIDLGVRSTLEVFKSDATTMASSGPNSLSFPVKSYLPFRWIYRLFKITSILTRLPLWVLRAVIPGLRPHPQWTFQQTLMRGFVQAAVDIDSSIGVTPTLSLKPGKEGPRWTIVEPFEHTVYVGPLLSDKYKPTTTGGTWYGVDRAPTSPEGLKKVSLHLHGGAFVIGDGRIANTAFLCDTLVKHGGFDAVFAPQYRLAGYKGQNAFPAGLQDCLSTYLYLVRTLDIQPEHITLSGDSAGGNLAIALLRYLDRFGGQIGASPPGHVVLISPWVAPAAALATDYTTWPQYRTDFLPPSFIRWGAATYVEQSEHDGSRSEYVSALGHPFPNPVPVFLTWGSEEILSVDCALWADEMRKVPDRARFEVNIEANAPHDTLLVGDKAGWAASAAEVAAKIGRFVDDVES